VAHPRKSAADYGQLSLFPEEVPTWLQPVAPQAEPADSVQRSVPGTGTGDDDDDLLQFNQWLQQNHPASDE
jgi:hypothetical protein